MCGAREGASSKRSVAFVGVWSKGRTRFFSITEDAVVMKRFPHW